MKYMVISYYGIKAQTAPCMMSLTPWIMAKGVNNHMLETKGTEVRWNKCFVFPGDMYIPEDRGGCHGPWARWCGLCWCRAPCFVGMLYRSLVGDQTPKIVQYTMLAGPDMWRQRGGVWFHKGHILLWASSSMSTSAENPVDIFTKCLGGPEFRKFWLGIGMARCQYFLVVLEYCSSNTWVGRSLEAAKEG